VRSRGALHRHRNRRAARPRMTAAEHQIIALDDETPLTEVAGDRQHRRVRQGTPQGSTVLKSAVHPGNLHQQRPVVNEGDQDQRAQSRQSGPPPIAHPSVRPSTLYTASSPSAPRTCGSRSCRGRAHNFEDAIIPVRAGREGRRASSSIHITRHARSTLATRSPSARVDHTGHPHPLRRRSSADSSSGPGSSAQSEPRFVPRRRAESAGHPQG